MSSAHHTAHTVSNISNNRNLLKNNRNRYTKVKEEYLTAEAKHQPYINKCDLQKSELEDLRLKIRQQIIKERRRKIVLTSLLTPLMLSALAWLLYEIIR